MTIMTGYDCEYDCDYDYYNNDYDCDCNSHCDSHCDNYNWSIIMRNLVKLTGAISLFIGW